MNWISIIAIASLAVSITACEKHPASALPQKHGAGEHHPKSPGDAKHAAKSAELHAESGKAETAKPEGEAKSGEAPKFFPENK